jgi:hypothetical protein
MHPRLCAKARRAGGHLGNVKDTEALWAHRSGSGPPGMARRIGGGRTRRLPGPRISVDSREGKHESSSNRPGFVRSSERGRLLGDEPRGQTRGHVTGGNGECARGESYRSLPPAKMADRISHCAYFFGPPSKTPLLLSIPPRISHDRARNLNRPGTPIQAHNYNKVNGDTEAGQQKDADEAGTMPEIPR